MKTVLFYTTDIKLKVHTATHAQDLRTLTLQEFIGSHRARLQEDTVDHEYICTRDDGAFIQGKEV